MAYENLIQNARRGTNIDSNRAYRIKLWREKFPNQPLPPQLMDNPPQALKPDFRTDYYGPLDSFQNKASGDRSLGLLENPPFETQSYLNEQARKRSIADWKAIDPDIGYNVGASPPIDFNDPANQEIMASVNPGYAGGYVTPLENMSGYRGYESPRVQQIIADINNLPEQNYQMPWVTGQEAASGIPVDYNKMMAAKNQRLLDEFNEIQPLWDSIDSTPQIPERQKTFSQAFPVSDPDEDWRKQAWQKQPGLLEEQNMEESGWMRDKHMRDTNRELGLAKLFLDFGQQQSQDDYQWQPWD